MEDSQENTEAFEIGIYTLGDIVPDPHSGNLISTHKRIEEIIKAAKMADEAGLDVFGVGEHHRLDYAISSPQMMLAAIARETKHIKLTSATNVLSTSDPVRLFEDFATLDLISGGRAELAAGRGAFSESFPLFGYDYQDYDDLFEEHLELLTKLNEQAYVTWSGKLRAPLQNAAIAPRPLQHQLPIWHGVGRTPASAARAGKYGIGLMMAMIGGDYGDYQPLTEAYREASRQAGFGRGPGISVTGHSYIAETMEKAKAEFYPYYANYKKFSNPDSALTKQEFDQITGPKSALMVGGPQEVIDKALRQYELFGNRRLILQMDIGGMPFDKIAKNIELLARDVAPVLRGKIAAAAV